MGGEGDREAWARARVEGYAKEDLEELLQGLKKAELDAFRGDGQHVHVYADTILAMAEITGEPLHRGLGLRMKAQAYSLGQGNHKEAMPYFDEALRVYEECGDVVRQARTHISRLLSQMNLGDYGEALRTGRWAESVLEEHEQWRSLGTLRNNLAFLFIRNGEQRKALKMFDDAREAFLSLGEEGKIRIPNIDRNRSMTLHLFGKHKKAIEIGQDAILHGTELNQTMVVARTKHVIGSAYRALGNHTQALNYLAQAKDIYSETNQILLSAQADLTSAEILVEIRRFEEAIAKCRESRKIFNELGIYLDEAGSLHWEAVAQQGRGNFSAAHESFENALKIYEQINNQYFAADTKLALATLELKSNHPINSLNYAKKSLETFRKINMPVEVGYAHLAVSRAESALGRNNESRLSAQAALTTADELDMPHMMYQCHAILAEIAEDAASFQVAQEHYIKAIDSVEAWRGNIMSEYRSAFTEDKESVYERVVSLFLKGGDTVNAFNYVDRAKSASLKELLSRNHDLKIREIAGTDESDVVEINELIDRRRELFFHQKQSQKKRDNLDEYKQLQQVAKLENEIVESWHELLIRNHAYAQQFTPWKTTHESEFPLLDLDTVIIQYFRIENEYIALVAKRGKEREISVTAISLTANPIEVLGTMHSLQLNMATVVKGNTKISTNLTANANSLLARLHQYLITPIEEAIRDHNHLIFVPYKELHYIPFHALYDSNYHLVEKHEISYLPSALILNFLTTETSLRGQPLVVGHSQKGYLPNAAIEAREVANILGGKVLLEEEATIDKFQQYAQEANVIHFAGHGEFRGDNPLFSGLVFENGLLSTLDIFDLNLKAKLVTLSACESGLIEVGGGDELFGLMRAFFSCGVESLIISQWKVDDVSTRELMSLFYTELEKGKNISYALCNAQRKLIANDTNRHPYFWAPFYLIGNYQQKLSGNNQS